MRARHIMLPLLLAPLIASKHESRNDQGPAKAQARVINPAQTNQVAIELTKEEIKALDEIMAFLEKYTGNGKFNYGSIDRMVAGVKRDIEGIRAEGRKIGGIKGLLAVRSPRGPRVQREVERRARADMEAAFIEFGVDPATACKPDNCPIKNYVTKAELERYRDNSYVLKGIIEKQLPPDKKIVFKEGVSIEAAKFIKSRKPGLPQGVSTADKEAMAEEKTSDSEKEINQ